MVTVGSWIESEYIACTYPVRAPRQPASDTTESAAIRLDRVSTAVAAKAAVMTSAARSEPFSSTSSPPAPVIAPTMIRVCDNRLQRSPRRTRSSKPQANTMPPIAAAAAALNSNAVSMTATAPTLAAMTPKPVSMVRPRLPVSCAASAFRRSDSAGVMRPSSTSFDRSRVIFMAHAHTSRNVVAQFRDAGRPFIAQFSAKIVNESGINPNAGLNPGLRPRVVYSVSPQLGRSCHGRETREPAPPDLPGRQGHLRSQPVPDRLLGPGPLERRRAAVASRSARRPERLRAPPAGPRHRGAGRGPVAQGPRIGVMFRAVLRRPSSEPVRLAEAV